MDLYRRERWKPLEVAGVQLHGNYQISDMGRVKKMNDGKDLFLKSTPIKGYPSVHLKTASKKGIKRYVHKLVARHFLNQNGRSQEHVIHLDYDKNNNHYQNLKWVSKNELYKHHLNNPRVIKAKTTGYKLTENKVKVIKRLLKSNKSRLYVIAKRFNITHTQLNRIRSGENWGHVKIDD